MVTLADAALRTLPGFDEYVERLTALARVLYGNLSGQTRWIDSAATVEDLADVIGRTMRGAAMRGAEVVTRHHDRAVRENEYPIAKVSGGLEVAGIVNDSTLRDLVTREPRLATTAAEVSRLYSNEHAFALAKATSATVTAHVQGVIARAVEQGIPTPTAVKAIEELGGFTRSYAETVFRTNATTAFVGGQFAQMADPAIGQVMVGLEVVGPADSDARDNHVRMIGFRAAADDPRWRYLRPPYGYRCRHSLALIDRFRAEREGWLGPDGRLLRMDAPAGGGPDPGFRAAA